jgi:hypothetical protein
MRAPVAATVVTGIGSVFAPAAIPFLVTSIIWLGIAYSNRSGRTWTRRAGERGYPNPGSDHAASDGADML